MALREGARFLRRIIAGVVLAGCAIVVVFGIVSIAAFLLTPFSGFAGTTEFTELSGPAAKRRLSEDWPVSVDPASVRAVSHRSNWSRDSFSSWYKVRLTPSAAARWMNYIHAAQERDSPASLHNLHEGVEGVHRTVAGPPPKHWQTGDAPSWWSPPAFDFRATDAMLWYTDYDSGVGRATYSCLDASTRTLWVYEYACQHDALWPPNEVPPGMQFHRASDATSHVAAP